METVFLWTLASVLYLAGAVALVALADFARGAPETKWGRVGHLVFGLTWPVHFLVALGYAVYTYIREG